MGNFLSIGGDTVGSALDKICGLFGLTYHIDDNGVIVMEPAWGHPSAHGHDHEKIYWFKPGSFPANDPADKNPGDRLQRPLPPKASRFRQAPPPLGMRKPRSSRCATPRKTRRILTQVLAPDFAGAARFSHALAGADQRRTAGAGDR